MLTFGVLSFIALMIFLFLGGNILRGFGDAIKDLFNKTCPDCKKRVPNDAKVCSYCRYRFQEETKTKKAISIKEEELKHLKYDGDTEENRIKFDLLKPYPFGVTKDKLSTFVKETIPITKDDYLRVPTIRRHFVKLLRKYQGLGFIC